MCAGGRFRGIVLFLQTPTALLSSPQTSRMKTGLPFGIPSPKSLDRQGNKPLRVFECELRSPCDMASSDALNTFGWS